MPTDLPRCSALSMALGEPLIGTASTVPNWILLEHAGPWGREALRASRLPSGVGAGLRKLSRRLGVRIVLIRPYRDRRHDHGVRCFLAHTGPDEPWLSALRLDRHADLLDLDLSPMAGGGRPDAGEPNPGPMFVVCTHGRRDPCCAERGRPLARALHRVHGDRLWESSHIGGDRFAGNLVCFPHGCYFGRLDPGDAVGVAGAYARGEIDLDHYRGRSCHPFAVQAAEWFLRRKRGLVGIDDLRFVAASHPAPDLVEAEFALRDGRQVRHAVRVAPADPPRALTCHERGEVRPAAYAGVEVEPDPA